MTWLIFHSRNRQLQDVNQRNSKEGLGLYKINKRDLKLTSYGKEIKQFVFLFLIRWQTIAIVQCYSVTCFMTFIYIYLHTSAIFLAEPI